MKKDRKKTEAENRDQSYQTKKWREDFFYRLNQKVCSSPSFIYVSIIEKDRSFSLFKIASPCTAFRHSLYVTRTSENEEIVCNLKQQGKFIGIKSFQ